MATPIHISDDTKKKSISIRIPNFKKVKLKNALVALLIVGLAIFIYGYIHTKNQLNQAKNPSTAGKSEIQQIENQINSAIALPADETPTLATVSDANKLRSEIFFKNAQTGDKVLIYSKAGTAVLYRPSTKKVIEYAPVNLGSNQ